MPASIDSNKTSGYYNEEAALKVPGSGPWYPIEPNSYSDYGGDIKTVAREPITATRQRAKGTVTDLDVQAGWNEDFTQNNLSRLIQGFLFANARTKPTNLPLSSMTGVVAYGVSVVAGAPGSFHRAAGSFITDGWKVGHIFFTTGFVNKANNFLWVVTAVTATDLSVVASDSMQTTNEAGDGVVETSVLVAEAATVGVIEAVGFQLPSSATLTGVGSDIPNIALNCDAVNLTTLGLIAGEYLYIGDVDVNTGAGAVPHSFLTAGTVLPIRGYARIASIAAAQILFDVTLLENFGEATGAALAATLPNIYFGTVIQNEANPELIVRRTYTLLRTLGTDIEGAPVYETVSGAVPNEFTLNIPSNNKLAADLKLIAMDTESGSTEPSGTFLNALNEEPYNTSQDVYAMLLYIIDQTQPEQVPLFGYATDEKLTINNNVKPNKAIGVVGGFEASVGMLDVSGSLTCYFDDPAAIEAIRNNDNVGLINIFAKKLQGMIFDMSMLTLGGGRLKVEKDKPIMADITHTAAAGVNDNTILYNKFDYLPATAMSNYVPVVFI
jgi:hypothetical protein